MPDPRAPAVLTCWVVLALQPERPYAVVTLVLDQRGQWWHTREETEPTPSRPWHRTIDSAATWSEVHQLLAVYTHLDTAAVWDSRIEESSGA